MKKSLIYLIPALLILGSCARTVSTSTNSAAKRYFDAWISLNYPDAPATALGSYVIADNPGPGELLGDSDKTPYVRVNYTVTNLAGEVQNTNSETVSKQLGTYNKTYYYGPEVWTRADNGTYAGIDEALSTMSVGGSKKTVVPGWLATTDRYDTVQEYLDNVTSGSNYIYSVEVVERIDDIAKWETDSIVRYLAKAYPEVAPTDSLKYGFYLIERKAPLDTTSFTADTTIYINYTGRLLNGLVFDTNIKDTAKVYNLYSSSKTYSPTIINWPASEETYTDMTMTSSESTMIDGFAYALYKMRPFGKCTCIFYSGLGYSYSGSGNSIPAYAPLRFDIDIVDKEGNDKPAD